MNLMILFANQRMKLIILAIIIPAPKSLQLLLKRKGLNLDRRVDWVFKRSFRLIKSISPDSTIVFDSLLQEPTRGFLQTKRMYRSLWDSSNLLSMINKLPEFRNEAESLRIKMFGIQTVKYQSQEIVKISKKPLENSFWLWANDLNNYRLFKKINRSMDCSRGARFTQTSFAGDLKNLMFRKT